MEIQIGNFCNDLKIEQLNPLCLKTWFDIDGHIIDVFIEADAIDFLTDLRNGKNKFTFIGYYDGPQRFISVDTSIAHPISMHDYLKQFHDQNTVTQIRNEIVHAIADSY
ncbi:hypothetical protein [Lactiplantibacillus paraxiangfangensis]|uniref:hypothetical protein n=1 Tax=Lactiplantibacillus paraxiangfangensis TaxID=3076224 RepID=UPI0030C759E9